MKYQSLFLVMLTATLSCSDDPPARVFDKQMLLGKWELIESTQQRCLFQEVKLEFTDSLVSINFACDGIPRSPYVVGYTFDGKQTIEYHMHHRVLLSINELDAFKLIIAHRNERDTYKRVQ